MAAPVISSIKDFEKYGIGLGSALWDGTKDKLLKVIGFDIESLYEHQIPTKMQLQGNPWPVTPKGRTGFSALVTLMYDEFDADGKAVGASSDDIKSRYELLQYEDDGTTPRTDVIGRLYNRDIPAWDGWFPFLQEPRKGEPYDTTDMMPFITKRDPTAQGWANMTKKQQQQVKERIDTFKRYIPIQKSEDWRAQGKADSNLNHTRGVKSTPLVHYYVSRYLATAIELEKGDVLSENLPTKIKRPKSSESLRGTLVALAHFTEDNKTPIDYKFDLVPIHSTLTYPTTTDDDEYHETNSEPTFEDYEVGMLQMIYTGSSSKQKMSAEKAFDKDNDESTHRRMLELIQRLPRDYPYRSKGADGSITTIYGLRPELVEPVLLWIQESENIAAKATNTQAFNPDPYSPGASTWAPARNGSMLRIPGFMALHHEIDDRLLSVILGEGQMEQEIEYYIDGYFEAQRDDKLGDEEIEQWGWFLDFVNNVQEARVLSVGADSMTVEFTDYGNMKATLSTKIFDTQAKTLEIDALADFYGLKPPQAKKTGIHTTRWLFHDFRYPELVANEFSDLFDKPLEGPAGEIGYAEWLELEEEDREKYIQALSIQEPGIKEPPGFTNHIHDSEETDDRGYSALRMMNPYNLIPSDLAPDDGLRDRIEGYSIDIYNDEARPELPQYEYSDIVQFNALGKILIHLSISHGMQFTNRRNNPSVSMMDKTVDALLGTERRCGLATLHASLHHALLIQNFYASLALPEIGKALVTAGSTIALETYTSQPAKLMCIWLLTETGLVDIMSIDGKGVPQFFSAPKDRKVELLNDEALMNNMARVIVAYYRVAFSYIGNRGAKIDERTNLQKLWQQLIANSRSDSPEPEMFAAVLRYMKQALTIPTWMPTLPKNILGEKKRDKKEVENFLVWSYGRDPISMQHFGEVSAAYHAAKALSAYEPGEYGSMVEKFLDAVAEDYGEPFLMAVLLEVADDLKPGKAFDMTPDPSIGAVPVKIVELVGAPVEEEVENEGAP